MEFLVKGKLICLLLFLGWEAWIDSKEKYIAVKEVILFGILGLVFSLYLDKSRILLFQLTGMIPGLLAIGTARITEEAIGYGDGLLLLVCGCYLGVFVTAGIFFMALLICMPYMMYLLISGRAGKKTEIAFAPFLLVAYVCWMVVK